MRGLDDILWQLCLRCWGLSDLPLQSINEIVMALDPLHGENYVECPLLWREEDLESWIESRTPALRLRLGARIERFEEITAERDIARLHRGVEIKAVLPTSTGPCEVKVIQMWRHRRTELEKGHALVSSKYTPWAGTEQCGRRLLDRQWFGISCITRTCCRCWGRVYMAHTTANIASSSPGWPMARL